MSDTTFDDRLARADALSAADAAAALPLWQQLVTERPDFERALLSEAACWRKLGKPNEAAVRYELALSRWPHSEAALVGLAQLATERGDWADAKRRWSDVTAVVPDHVWGKYWYAVAVAKLGEHDASAELLLNLLANPSPQLSQDTLRFRLVETYLEGEDSDRALVMFKDLLKYGKVDPTRLDSLAWWIIRVAVRAPGYPTSVFAMDECLRSRVLV